MPDMLFIMLLAVLLFGPKKMPEIARQIARFKNARDNLKAQLETEFGKLEAEARDIMPSGAEDLKSAFEPLTNMRQHFDNVISSSIEPEDKPKPLPDAPAAENPAPAAPPKELDRLSEPMPFESRPQSTTTDRSKSAE